MGSAHTRPGTQLRMGLSRKFRSRIVPNSDVPKLRFCQFRDGAPSFSYRSRMGIIFCLFWYCTRRLIRLFRNRHCPYQNGHSDALINNHFGTGSAYPRTGRHLVLCLDQNGHCPYRNGHSDALILFEGDPTCNLLKHKN